VEQKPKVIFVPRSVVFLNLFLDVPWSIWYIIPGKS